MIEDSDMTPEDAVLAIVGLISTVDKRDPVAMRKGTEWALCLGSLPLMRTQIDVTDLDTYRERTEQLITEIFGRSLS